MMGMLVTGINKDILKLSTDDFTLYISGSSENKKFKATNNNKNINAHLGIITNYDYITETINNFNELEINNTNTMYPSFFEDGIYNIYLEESSTLIYSDGITAGWSPEGDNFKYKSVQLKSNVYVNNKLVLLDNLIVNPINNDVTKLGFFEEYSNFGTLLVINKNVDDKVITELREVIRKLNLPVDFGISKLEVNGFVLRVLGNLTQHIEQVTGVCHNYIRKSFLGSKDLIIRKY